MAVNTSFSPQGNTILLTTNAAPSTANHTNLTLANIGLQYYPMMVRVFAQAGPVFLSFTGVSATITAPTAGAGGGTACIALNPNVVEVFTIPAFQTLWINDISATASCNYYLIFGEGM